MPVNPPCIISALCEINDGLLVDASATKEYSWKPVIKSFFEKSVSIEIYCISYNLSIEHFLVGENLAGSRHRHAV